MRSKNVLTGSVATGLLSLVTILYGLLIPKAVVLTYGSEINGLTTSINQFISYFSLLEAGLAGSAIFAMYKPLAVQDYGEINGILAASKKYYDKISLIYALGVCAFSLVFACFFAPDGMGFLSTVLICLAVGSTGVLEFATMSKYRVLLTAAQKTDVVSFAAILGVLLRIVLSYALVWIRASIVLVMLLPGCMVLVRSAILSVYVKKNFPLVRYDVRPNNSQLKQRGDVLLMQVLGSVHQAFPTVAMTLFGISFAEISVYTVYTSITAGIKSLLNVFLNGSIYSTFGEVIAKKDYATLKRAAGEFEVGAYWLISVIFACLSILYMPFINIYTAQMADANYTCPELAFMLTLNAYLYVIKNPLASMIQAAGHYQKTRWRTVTQAVIAVVVGTALAKPLGVTGIMIGMICSNLYRTVDIVIYVPKNIILTTSWASLRRMFSSVVSVVLAFSSFHLLFDVAALNYLQWLMWAVVAGVWSVMISTGITLLVSKKEFRSLLVRVKALAGKLIRRK